MLIEIFINAKDSVLYQVAFYTQESCGGRFRGDVVILIPTDFCVENFQVPLSLVLDVGMS